MTTGWESEASDIAVALDTLTDLMVAEEALPEVLDRVVTLARDGIGNCDFASITWMKEYEFETVASTDETAREIDEVQYAVDSGPCLYAFRRRELVSVPSMSDGSSWQPVRDAAVERGVHSSLSLPLAVGDERMGALNLYGRSDHAFSSVPSAPALLFAKQAAAAMCNARAYAATRKLIGDLQTALETRQMIGTATGIIMANERTQPEPAFDLLRAASQHQNVKLRDLAKQVIETGETPATKR